MAYLPDQSFGRYRIIEALGKDGLISTYLALDTRLNCQVEIRVIPIENLPQKRVDKVLERFDQEAKIATSLVHKNIVAANDFGRFEGTPFFVTEHLHGGSLQTLLVKRGKVPFLEATKLLFPVVDALAYTHSKGIIHLNLKPAFILLDKSGIPALFFFRTSKILEDETSQDLTANLAAIDAPEYKAPEQITTKNADARTDIYALGSIFYEMVTGQVPFTADTPLAILFKHVTEPLPWPSQFVKGLPEAIELILIKALEKKPEDRYQSMPELKEAFEQILVDSGIPVEKEVADRAQPPVQPVPVEKKPARPTQVAQPPVQPVPAEKKPARPTQVAQSSAAQPGPVEKKPAMPAQPAQPQPPTLPAPDSFWNSSQVTGYSEVLLEAARIELYRINAFRIMELPVDATPRDLSKRQQIIDLATNTGLPVPSGSGRALPLALNSDSNLIQEAMQRLRDPERRLVDEFFWFWPHQLNMSSSDEALLALSKDEVEKARQLWITQENEQSEANISIHNLAILSHLKALELEEVAKNGTLTPEQEKQRDALWVQAFSHWKKLIEQENFWSRLTLRIRDLDDPRLTTGMARRMRASLPPALLIINTKLALQAAESGNLADVKRHKGLMTQSGFPKEIMEEAMRRVLSPVREIIRSLCRTADSDVNANPERGDKIARSLFEQTRTRLDILDSFYPAGHPTRDSLHDDVAQQMLTCELIFVNKTEKWSESLKTLDLIQSVAVGTTIKSRIEENRKIIKSNIELGLCWFCQKRKGDKGAAIEVKMHGEVTRTPNFTYGQYRTQVQWKYRTIEVPRCNSCKNTHSKKDHYATLGGVIGFALGLGGCIAISSSNSDLTCLGIFVLITCLSIGIGIGSTISSKKLPEGIKPLKATNDFPIIKELLAKGWQMGEKPPGVQ